jgi:uncharacterized repeat protein (TIGR03803 family)
VSSHVLARGRRAFAAATLGFVCVLSAAVPAAAASTTTIHRFDGVDGSMPSARLVQASDGFLYGTSAASGDGGNSLDGLIYRISPAGAYEVVHRFDRCHPAGYNPLASLIQASDGYLYGTTSRGGEGNDCVGTLDTRAGTVFRLDPATFAVTPLHTFGAVADGYRPTTAVVQGRDGALYGTTNLGGNVSQTYPLGRGTIYRVTRSGAFSVLRRFNGCDGHVPDAPLMRASDGHLYGTTNARRCTTGSGSGTIFRISQTGEFRRLHTFASDDGVAPVGRLVQAADGRLYGVTQKGGPYQDGVVYRITTAGVLEVLHRFGFDGGYGTTGMEPRDGLVVAPDGSFYGTAQFGGLPIEDPDRSGVIFRMNRGGTKLDVVHTFLDGTPDGIQPLSGLALARNGRLYGTTIGGPSRLGTIFRFAPMATATLDAVSVYPGELWSGEPGFDSTTGRVILDGLAPAGGATVTLSTDRPDVIDLPASVKVAAGWAVRAFEVTASPTSEDTLVTVRATYGGVTRRTTLWVYAGI